ncbi:hypothetical protein RJ55_03618 [Drechmeria coniospora]|nr:hypothetical protein RJ55_03618 [Drechmeria coniospora]
MMHTYHNMENWLTVDNPTVDAVLASTMLDCEASSDMCSCRKRISFWKFGEADMTAKSTVSSSAAAPCPLTGISWATTASIDATFSELRLLKQWLGFLTGYFRHQLIVFALVRQDGNRMPLIGINAGYTLPNSATRSRLSCAPFSSSTTPHVT